MTDPYGTHAGVLATVANHILIRSVLEFGGGIHSTSLFLNLSAFPELAQLTTVETDAEWAAQIKNGDERHTIIERPQLSKLLKPEYDLIFVDDATSMTGRIETLRAVSAARPDGLVVIHDYEHPEYQEAARFDHVAVSKRLTPWTAVAWNEGSRHGSVGLHRVVADA